jgi:hypothetical protein
MTTNGLTPTPVLAADRAARRVRAVVKANAARKTGELSDLDSYFRCYDAAYADGHADAQEAVERAVRDAAKDDGQRPPSRPNVPPGGPPKAVEYYAELGGEAGSA